MMRPLFRRILVPHDFSLHADRALRTAADLARGAGGRLTVLHLVATYPATGMAPPILDVAAPAPGDLVTPARAHLASASAGCSDVALHGSTCGSSSATRRSRRG